MNLHTVEGHRQFCLPKFAHFGVITRLQRFTKKKKLLDLSQISCFENRSRTTRARFLKSFALPDEAVRLQLS